MSRLTKAVVLVVVFTIVPVALSRVIWPFPVGMAMPPASLMPIFIGLSFVDCLMFGLGAAFVALGYPLLRSLGQRRPLTVAAYLSIAFLMLSWWPHDNLHITSGGNFTTIAAIDVAFHLPLMVAAVVVAVFFLRAAGVRIGREPRAEMVTAPAGSIRAAGE